MFSYSQSLCLEWLFLPLYFISIFLTFKKHCVPKGPSQIPSFFMESFPTQKGISLPCSQSNFVNSLQSHLFNSSLKQTTRNRHTQTFPSMSWTTCERRTRIIACILPWERGV
jgi:hypothetical protein